MSKEAQKLTSNQYTNVKDIRDIFLYTKNRYVMCYLKISSYNIELLSDEEKIGKTNILSKAFGSDRKDFVYFSYPREIDLDNYKQKIKTMYDNCFNDFGKKHILSEMMQEATELETNGENFEHQHYIKIWRAAGSDLKETEKILRGRINDFRERYEMVGIRSEILHADEIIKMCNLYGNSNQAPFDVPSDRTYESMMIMR